jgi:selenocysteine lyase/cysteine desulfurase
MLITRRSWLSTATALSAWPMLHTSAAQRPMPAPPAGASDDEAFWTAVRARFELVADRINLVTVVRGVTTRATRELVAAETERDNAFRPSATPNPNWKQDVRTKVAAFIGAPAASVALVRNTTEGVTTVLANWPLARGDEILTSSAEHGPFYDTLAARAARDGLVVRRFHYPAPARSLDDIVAAIDRALTARTRLVQIGQVVLTGQINPVRAIADLVHARGAKLLVDGVLAVGHVAIDVTAMDCDFFAAGFHKWGCGPRATAAFYVKPALVAQLPPLFGAYRENDRGEATPRWNSAEMGKYESFGAHPAPHFVGLGSGIDVLAGIGMPRIQARLFALTSRWMTRAQRAPRFRAAVALDPTQCAGLVAWELEGLERPRVREVLTANHLLVGSTESYAGFFGIPEDRPRSLFIANVGLFTSPADVDRLADAIEQAGR